jgi:ubiquinone/menaquinone biosynthesis C-methylase UbiE
VYDLVMWGYYAAHARRPPDPARYVLAQQGWLPERADVLDLGGGDGRWALPPATARAARVTVADIDAAALRRVPRHPLLRSMPLIEGPLPFPDAAYDLAFVNHVVHHVAHLPAVLRELRRVVRPGGRLVCIEFHPGCAVTRIYRAFSRFRVHPCTFYEPEALARLLGVPPFVAEHRPIDRFQYVATARHTP